MATSANVSINRVSIVWTGAFAVGTGLSTFYFNSAVGTPAQQVAAVQTFLAATEDRRVIGMNWVSAADVVTLNIATGALEAINTVTPVGGSGTLAGDALPPATQGLLRILSNVISNDRLIRGRLFLPGTGESSSTLGAPDSAYLTDYNNAAAALISDANTEWRLWSRTHGLAPDVITASTWNKWAVLRSRRD